MMVRQGESGREWWARCSRVLLVAQLFWMADCLSGTARAVGTPKPAQSPQTLASQPPPGFDELLQPQQTLVDVVFGNRKIGTAMAVYSPGTLQFKDPTKVVDFIPELADPKSILSVLSHPLPTHTELVCAHGLPANCGQLTPAVVGIIFDEARFQVDVFINPIYVRAAKLGAARFLPTPASRIAVASCFTTSARDRANDCPTGSEVIGCSSSGSQSPKLGGSTS